PNGLIERGVDFNRVEVSCEIFERMEAAWFQLRINNSIPVWVRPAGRSTVEGLGEGHNGTPSFSFYSPPVYAKKRRKSSPLWPAFERWVCKGSQRFRPAGNRLAGLSVI